MWRLFITLGFMITTFTLITSAHSRVPANENIISLCPDDAHTSYETIFEPLYNKDLHFSCRLKEKNEYVKIQGTRKTYASAYKVEGKYFLKDLNIFEQNKLVEFRKYSMDQTLQKWEIYNTDETPFFMYSAAAQKLEEFDLESKEHRRQCFYDKELNAYVDIHNTIDGIVVANNLKEEEGQIIHETHLSSKKNPAKFFHQITTETKSIEINIELCLREKVSRKEFFGVIKFINQEYTVIKQNALSQQKLIKLLEKEDQEIIDFLNTLGPQ
jgi:hypothetical protein